MDTIEEMEALNRLYFDIHQISKKRNRFLTILLCISLACNIVLLSMAFQVRVDKNKSGDETQVRTAMVTKTPSDHIITRGKLKEIPDIETFEGLLQRCILTDDEKFILREHYLHGRSFISISMEMGYSEDAIKHRHQKILKKIKKIL